MVPVASRAVLNTFGVNCCDLGGPNVEFPNLVRAVTAILVPIEPVYKGASNCGGQRQQGSQGASGEGEQIADGRRSRVAELQVGLHG